MDLSARVSAVKMAVAKDFVLEVVEINGNNMHTEINLIEQDIKVPI